MFGYGGAAARQAGVLMLDLRHLNRIVEVNEKHAYVVVEPGVSYLDLQRELARRQSRLIPAPPAAGWGSVVGNLLERGHGYTPAAEQFDNLCGLQVLLSDGTLFDTGFGAFDKSPGRAPQCHGSWSAGRRPVYPVRLSASSRASGCG
ncbi:MAG: FAD-dependent oxidoreductase [Polyangiaceae bacterium]